MDIVIGNKYAFQKERPHVSLTNQGEIDNLFGPVMDLPAHIQIGESMLLVSKDPIRQEEGTIGLVVLRSTAARMGLISPPTVIDPGFEGHVTLELFNGSKARIWLEPGMSLWSVHNIPTLDGSYVGRYQGQSGLTLPKAFARESLALSHTGGNIIEGAVDV